MRRLNQMASSTGLVEDVTEPAFHSFDSLITGEGRVEVRYVLYSDQTKRARARAKLNVCISVLIYF